MIRALVLLLAGLLAPTLVHAQGCPAEAREASRAIWASGSISSGKSVTATHPCGRRITCTGGKGGAAGTRSCRWR